MGYSPQGHTESDTTEENYLTHTAHIVQTRLTLAVGKIKQNRITMHADKRLSPRGLKKVKNGVYNLPLKYRHMYSLMELSI